MLFVIFNIIAPSRTTLCPGKGGYKLLCQIVKFPLRAVFDFCVGAGRGGGNVASRTRKPTSFVVGRGCHVKFKKISPFFAKSCKILKILPGPSFLRSPNFEQPSKNVLGQVCLTFVLGPGGAGGSVASRTRKPMSVVVGWGCSVKIFKNITFLSLPKVAKIFNISPGPSFLRWPKFEQASKNCVGASRLGRALQVGQEGR